MLYSTFKTRGHLRYVSGPSSRASDASSQLADMFLRLRNYSHGRRDSKICGLRLERDQLREQAENAFVVFRSTLGHAIKLAREVYNTGRYCFDELVRLAYETLSRAPPMKPIT